MPKSGSKAFKFAVIAAVTALSGCIDYYPSVSRPFGVAPTDANLHVSRVVTELQCELRDFSDNHPGTLDPAAAAVLSILYQTDVTGSLNYVGVDLSKIGLVPLTSLIALQNKVPNLGIKALSKGTNIWQVDLNLPQGGKTKGLRIPSKEQCKNPATRFPPMLRFDVDDWLEKFFLRLDRDQDFYFGTEDKRFTANLSDVAGSCLKTITIKTTFQVLVDVSGGASTGVIGVLPVSALNFDYNPQFTHTLSLALTPAQTSQDNSCKPKPMATTIELSAAQLKAIADAVNGRPPPDSKGLVEKSLTKPSFSITVPTGPPVSQPAIIPQAQ